MSRVVGSLLSFFLLISLCFRTFASDDDIRISSIGFLPERSKVFTVTAEAESFEVYNQVDDSVVFEGVLTELVADKKTRIAGSRGDFSQVATPGIYYIEVPGVGRSDAFPISSDIYNTPFKNVMRGFYGWRSGIDISLTHGGVTFSHAAGHLNDGLIDYILQEALLDGGIGDGGDAAFDAGIAPFDAGMPGDIKDGVGGWYDAGDYGKYVVNAAFTVGMMMAAWEEYRSVLSSVILEIPENQNNVPDYLDEIRYELEWLLKMQLHDGRVSHKLTPQDFCPMETRPADDSSPRYFSPYTTAATAAFTGATAQAARIFRDYDPVFAERCLSAATHSYEYLQIVTENLPGDNYDEVFADFDTGAYSTSDRDDRLWAAAEMWATTGSPEALADFEERGAKSSGLVVTGWDWSNLQNLGFCTYLRGTPYDGNRNPEFLTELQDDMVKAANSIVTMSEDSLFGRGISNWNWGSNGTLARSCMLTQAAYRINPDTAYLDVCAGQIDYLYGRNPYGRSQVTGEGRFPPCNPHDRRSVSDDILRPYPGLLVGGASSPRNWRDERDSYETNEVANNWNGALAYAFASFITGSAAPSAVGYTSPVDDCTQAPPKAALPQGGEVGGPPVIIDDLEDGDLHIIETDGRSGSWYAFDDGTEGQRSELTITNSGAHGSAHAIAITAMNYTRWGGGIALSLNGTEESREPYDASQYAGISFWAKAEQEAEIRVMVMDRWTAPEGGSCTTCNDHFYVPVELSRDWKRYDFSWFELQQRGWGDQRDEIDTKAIYTIQFQWTRDIVIDLKVDDVAFATAPIDETESGANADTGDKTAMDAGVDASDNVPKGVSGGCSCNKVVGSQRNMGLFELIETLF